MHYTVYIHVYISSNKMWRTFCTKTSLFTLCSYKFYPIRSFYFFKIQFLNDNLIKRKKTLKPDWFCHFMQQKHEFCSLTKSRMLGHQFLLWGSDTLWLFNRTVIWNTLASPPVNDRKNDFGQSPDLNLRLWAGKHSRVADFILFCLIAKKTRPKYTKVPPQKGERLTAIDWHSYCTVTWFRGQLFYYFIFYTGLGKFSFFPFINAIN